jgi:hypothetical protein
MNFMYINDRAERMISMRFENFLYFDEIQQSSLQ